MITTIRSLIRPFRVFFAVSQLQVPCRKKQGLCLRTRPHCYVTQFVSLMNNTVAWPVTQGGFVVYKVGLPRRQQRK